MAAVHFTWAGPEVLTVLRVLAPGLVLVLLDHDTLLTARWEAEELRRFAVLDLLPNSLSTEPLGCMDVEVDETQPCGSLPSSPWSCSPDGFIPCGARSPDSIGMVCASEDQLEANGGLVLFYPDAPDARHPQPPTGRCHNGPLRGRAQVAAKRAKPCEAGACEAPREAPREKPRARSRAREAARAKPRARSHAREAARAKRRGRSRACVREAPREVKPVAKPREATCAKPRPPSARSRAKRTCEP